MSGERRRSTGEAAIGVSLLVHAVAGGIAAFWLDPDDRVVAIPDEEPDARPVVAASTTTDAIGIEVIALPSVAPVAPAPASADAAPGAPTAVVVTPHPGTSALGAAAVGTGTEAAGSTGTGVEPRGTSGTEGALGMRGKRHDLRVSGEVLERIVGEGGAPPEEVKPSGRIEPRGDGGVIHDRVATVTVHPDGTVDLKGKPNASIHIAPPIPTMNDLRIMGRDIAKWYADPMARYRVGRMQDLPRHITAIPGACSTWGDPTCEDQDIENNPDGRVPATEHSGILPLVFGKLDLTALLADKLMHDDVYKSRKLKLLDSTREERIASGTRYRIAQQARSAEYVQKNLEALWAATADALQRRAALFAMWDECTEDEAGQRARSVVIGWIAGKLPAGSPGAFTADEIAKLDGVRASKQHFAPYAP